MAAPHKDDERIFESAIDESGTAKHTNIFIKKAQE